MKNLKKVGIITFSMILAFICLFFVCNDNRAKASDSYTNDIGIQLPSGIYTTSSCPMSDPCYVTENVSSSSSKITMGFDADGGYIAQSSGGSFYQEYGVVVGEEISLGVGVYEIYLVDSYDGKAEYDILLYLTIQVGSAYVGGDNYVIIGGTNYNVQERVVEYGTSTLTLSTTTSDTITWVVDDGEVVSSTGTVISSGKDNTTFKLSTGSYTMTAVDYTATGGMHILTINLTVGAADSTAPVIKCGGTTLSTSYTYKNANCSLVFTDNSALKSYTISGAISKSGTISGTSYTYGTLSTAGTYTIVLKDSAGNNKTGYLVIDKTAPTILCGSTTLSSSTTYLNTSCTLKLADNVALSTGLKLNSSGAELDETGASGTSFTWTTISTAGTYYYKAIDKAGNTVTRTFVIDKTAPTILCGSTTLSSSTTYLKANCELKLADNAALASGYELSSSGSEIDETGAGGTSFTWTTISTEGTYYYKAIDKAGNTVTRTFVIDKTAPTILCGSTTLSSSTTYLKANCELKLADNIDLASGLQLNSSGAELDETGADGTSFSWTTISTEGTYYYKAFDSAGNTTSRTFVIDKTAPTNSSTGGGSSWASSVTIAGAGSDSLSGLHATPYCLSTSSTSCSGSWSTSINQSYTTTTNSTVYTLVRDKAGNLKAKTHTVKVDKTNPTISTSGASTSWTTSSRTITITGGDSHSGVAYYYCNGAWKSSTASSYSCTISGTKTSTVGVKDAIGNNVTSTVNVYSSPDAPTVTYSGHSTSWTNSSRTITIVASEGISGISQYYCHGTWYSSTASSYDCTISVSQQYIAIGAKSTAGKSTTIEDVPVFIDKDAPINSSTGGGSSWASSVTIAGAGSDSLSGLHATPYCLSTSSTSCSGSWATSINQSYTTQTNTTVYTLVRDKAGNLKAKTHTVKVDKTNPTISTSGTSTSWTSSSRTITITGGDSHSGVAYYYCNGAWKSSTASSYSCTISGTKTSTVGVKDAIGNSVTSTVNVYSDVNVTSISTTGGSTTWATSRTITLKGQDSLSGIVAYSCNNGSTWTTVTATTAAVSYTCSFTSTVKTQTLKLKDSVGNIASTTPNIYVDKTGPSLSTSGTSTSWTSSSRTITLTASDANVGAISHYYCNGAWKSSTAGTYSCTISDAKTSTVGVKDSLGNQTTKSVNVYSDKTAPSVTYSGDSTTWTTSDRTITINGSENLSGITQYYCHGTWYDSTAASYACKISSTQKVIAIGAKNGSGLTTIIEDIAVYVDKSAPTLTISGNSTTWTASNRTITLQGSDANVGSISHYYCNGSWVASTAASYSCTFSSTTKTATVGVKDGLGNEYTVSTNVYVDKTAPSLSTSGASTTYATSRTIKLTASDAHVAKIGHYYCNGSWVSSTATSYDCTFSSTTTTATVGVKDSLGNSKTTTVNVYVDKTAPSLSTSGASTSWTTSSRKITLSATDANVGTIGHYYCNGSWVASTAASYSCTISNAKTATVGVKDGLGNQTTTTVNVYSDNVVPTLSTSGASTTYATSRTITLTGGDTLSGVAGYYCNDAWVTSTSGTYSCKFTATKTTATVGVKDAVGKQTTTTVNVYVDKTAPSLSTSGASTSWTTSSRKITLSATDANVGTIGHYYCNGSWVASTAASYSCTISNAKTATVGVKDGLGNQTTTTVNVYSDNVVPTLSTSGASTTYATSRTITLTGGDTLSGVAGYYCNDAWVASTSGTYSCKFTTTKTTATVGVKDAVGKQTTTTVNVYVDKTAPSLSTSGTSTSWTTSSRKITLSATDANVGTIGHYYCNGSWVASTAASYSCTISNAKTATVGVKDGLGNQTTKTVNVYSDTTAPSVTYSGNSTTWTTSDRTITINGSENLSGITQYYCHGTWYDSTAASYACKISSTQKVIAIGAKNGAGATTIIEDIAVYVDKTAPTLTISGNSTTWIASDRTITLKGSDANVGSISHYYCNGAWVASTAASYDCTFSSTTKTATVGVKDSLGNEYTISTNVYVDKTGPSVTPSGASTTWTASNRTITIAASDAHKGSISHYYCNGAWVASTAASYSCAFSSTTKTATVGAKDSLGNQTTKTVNVYVDKTGPSVTPSGASTTWTAGNRTITIAASDAHKGAIGHYYCNGAWVASTAASYSCTFSSTAKTATIGAKDSLGNQTTKTVNVYVDKTAPTMRLDSTSGTALTAKTNYYYNVASKVFYFADAHSGYQKA
ncbi:MAG: hypothetical protein E7184_03980, partial [Erysipelotrichaceae bacterium]|nr:hypothetical protein [Erysipelotrichaceae bacterium]